MFDRKSDCVSCSAPARFAFQLEVGCVFGIVRPLVFLEAPSCGDEDGRSAG